MLLLDIMKEEVRTLILLRKEGGEYDKCLEIMESDFTLERVNEEIFKISYKGNLGYILSFDRVESNSNYEDYIKINIAVNREVIPDVVPDFCSEEAGIIISKGLEDKHMDLFSEAVVIFYNNLLSKIKEKLLECGGVSECFI